METTNHLFIFMGLKHSGKSTLARMAGREMGFEVIDLDDSIAGIARSRSVDLAQIEENAACVRALYHLKGKAGFQEIEAEAAETIASSLNKPSILALGGGTMENSPAMAALQSRGTIIFLDAPCDLLFQRIIRGGIPAFLDANRPDEHFKEIFERRRQAALSYAVSVITLGANNIDEAYLRIKTIIKEFMDAR